MGGNTTRTLSGKIYDPVFLCMLGAVVLAVGTSVMLRTLASPQRAQAADPAPTQHHAPATPDLSDTRN